MRAEPTPPAPREGGDYTTVRELLDAVRRNARLVAAVMLATVALVMLATLLIRPRYESQAVLRIKPSDDPRTSMLSSIESLEGMSSLGALSKDEIDTEIGVLRSRRILDPVAEEVALHVRLKSPRRPRHEVLRVIRAPQDAPRGKYSLRRQADGSYTLRARPKVPIGGPLPERVEIGQPFAIGSLTLALQPTLRGEAPARVEIRVDRFRSTVEALYKRVRVKQQKGKSRLVEVVYRHPDPHVAAGVVNGMTEHFLAYKEQTTNAESHSKVEVLTDQVAQYADELRVAETRLQHFREAERIVEPEEEAVQQVGRLAELQQKHDALVVERQALATLLAEVRTSPHAADAPSPYRRLATFPALMATGGVQNILGNLTNYENQRAQLLARRTEEDPDVQAVSERIDELELQLYQIGANYLANLDRQLASADALMRDFGTEMARLPGRDVAFMRLVRDQKLLDEVYTVLQTRLKEAEVEAAIDPGTARLLDQGLVGYKPAWPRPYVNLALSAVLGLLLGLAAATGREMLDTTVRSRDDARLATGAAPVLGAVPHIRDAAVRTRRGAGRLFGGRAAHDARSPRPYLAAAEQPRSPAAEAFRALRTALTFASAERAPQVVVVTSALPGDGKSVVATNLAITFAQQGARTLLVDADLRHGALHRAFGTPAEPGLAGLLLGGAALEQAVRRAPLGAAAALDLLPAGAAPPNPAELLGSPRLRDAIAALRERYDVVIFDAPALDVVTDAGLLSTQADTTLLVARAGVTERDALHAAAVQLQLLGTRLGGVVLNDQRTAAAWPGSATSASPPPVPAPSPPPHRPS